MKKIISLLLAASAFLTSSAFAKSDDWINPNLDKMHAMLYEEDFRVFAESGAENYVYYGAKFEPRSGSIIGTPFNCDFDGIDNGIKTYYEWFTPSEELKNHNVPRKEVAEKESDHTKLIGWNWNFASKVPVNMSEYENYVKNYIDNLAARGEDILLVFGKEMNIDDNFIDEQVFIDCFRYVADYAHTKENIAMVWAPNDTGGLDTRLIDFYPGDKYVDWIGCSLYSMPYFTGDKNANEGANIGFIMGPYANPVMRAKLMHNFMVENNIKKPVFITEGGVGYQSPDGEDFSGWAVQQLRKYYGELVRAYPEFKCIVAFNNYVPPGDYYRYDMGSNPMLLENIQMLTKDPVYITDYTKNSDVSYVGLYNGMEVGDTLKLSAYGYQPKVQWMKVKYFVDGREVHLTEYPPYKYTVTGLSEGNHTVRAEFYTNDNLVKSLEYNVNAKPKLNRVYKDEEYLGGCDFSDMDSMSAEVKNAVTELSERGVISGIGDNKFAPMSKVTRAEISSMLVRALKLSGGNETFPDVAESAWYYKPVLSAKKAGLLDGFEDGTFRPEKSVTNEQLIAILAKHMEKLGMKSKNTKLPFTDVINTWAQKYVQLGYENGITLAYEGNTFRSETAVTRADCAVMINRFLKVIEK